MKCGFVSLVGRPNVGKSTLLNSLLGMKLAITSDVSGTTRNVIQGIYNDEDSQIIFVDTPGIHKPTHKLGTLLNKKAYKLSFDSVEGIYKVKVNSYLTETPNYIIEVHLISEANKASENEPKYEEMLNSIVEKNNVEE